MLGEKNLKIKLREKKGFFWGAEGGLGAFLPPLGKKLQVYTRLWVGRLCDICLNKRFVWYARGGGLI